jgi:acetyltransferase-like isoleucine patch superfamily enzyme
MKLVVIIHELRKKIKGRLKVAKENGMIVEEGVTVMGGVNFGSEPYLITLHKNCRISSDVCFVNHDGGTYAFRNHWEKYKNVIKYGTIEIGEETFIGARSIIMPGVKIGRNSVVGVGSVVTKNVPDETVVSGIPAKRMCSIQEYAEKCRASMPQKFRETDYQADKKKYLMDLFYKK